MWSSIAAHGDQVRDRTKFLDPLCQLRKFYRDTHEG